MEEQSLAKDKQQELSAATTPPVRGRSKGGRHGRGRNSGRGTAASSQQNKPDGNSVQTDLVIDSVARGVVANVRESFGFIRAANHDGIFFHASEVLISKDGQTEPVALNIDEGARIDLTQVLSQGDEVEFMVAPGARGARFSAKQVKVLAKGGVSAPAQTSSVNSVPQGIIKQLPTMGSANWRNRQEVLDGIITCQPLALGSAVGAAEMEELPFGESDLAAGRGRLQVGDQVKFVVKQRWDAKRATQVQLVPGGRSTAEEAPKGPRLLGFVYSYNAISGRGSIRRADGEGQLSFALAQVVEESQAAMGYKSEVEFSLARDDRSRKETAVAIVCLPTGTIPGEERLPDRIGGRVMRIPAQLQGQPKERPGAIRCDDPDLGTVISFSSVESIGEVPGEGDDVTFTRVVNRRSGAVWAADLSITCTAAERRELGQVAVLKGKFGFIKCCERRGDLFFHFDALAEGLSSGELAVGDDVEFSVGFEPEAEDQPPRAVALRVVRAAKGAAVFETLSEQRYTGVIMDRLQSNGYTTVSCGLLQYVDDNNHTSRLTFGSDDLAAEDSGHQLHPGDRVSFRLATRLKAARQGSAVGGTAAQHAGRRASEVQCLRFQGTVFSWKATFGFIDLEDTKALGIKGRLYFHAGDVQGGSAAVGQHVTGVLAENGKGEDIARAIKALPMQEVPPAPAENGAATPPATRPKMNLKPSSNSEAGRKPPAARIAVGPDGTRGFAPGRGRGIVPPPPGILSAAASAPGSDLKTTLSGRLLNPSAAEFVPNFTSLGNLSASVAAGPGSPAHALEGQHTNPQVSSDAIAKANSAKMHDANPASTAACDALSDLTNAAVAPADEPPTAVDKRCLDDHRVQQHSAAHEPTTAGLN